MIKLQMSDTAHATSLCNIIAKYLLAQNCGLVTKLR